MMIVCHEINITMRNFFFFFSELFVLYLLFVRAACVVYSSLASVWSDDTKVTRKHNCTARFSLELKRLSELNCLVVFKPHAKYLMVPPTQRAREL